MNKMSNYQIKKERSGEEFLILKNGKGKQIASGKLLSSKDINRRKLKNTSRDAAEANIELQLKDGYEVKEGTKFEVFRSDDDKISFRLREDSGNILLSGNSYNNISDCLAAVREAKESLRDMSNSRELTAIHQKPTFTAKKASPKFSSATEELKQAELRSKDIGFSVTLNEKKRPSFISGRISDEKITSSKKAICALNMLHHTMGFENAEQEFCEDDVEIRRQNDGTTFYRMKQYHKGIPVYANTLIMSTDSEGNTETLSGHYTPISCNDNIVLTEAQAKAIVEENFESVASSEGLIYYIDDDTEKASLCWCINTMENKFYISTVDGTIVKQYPNIIDIDINTSSRPTTTLGTTVDISILNKNGHAPYSLYDGTRNIEIFDDHNNFWPETSIETDSLNTEGIARLNETHTVSAYDTINHVYDYYLNVLGRKGADNNGKKIRIVMNDRYFPLSANAAFFPDVTTLTRIGVSTTGDLERCLDVLGHEFTHAVNDAIWTPEYGKQPGALDEAYADIMGEYIQDGTLDDCGEMSSIGTIRKFDNKWTFDKYNDRTDRHYNCQIITYAAYLIDEKWPTANKRCELSMLYYRSMEYLDPKSTFVDCYNALLMSALKNCLISNLNTKIGAIADSFLETHIFPNISAYKNSTSAVKVTGKVLNSSDSKGVAGVTVSAYLEGNTTNCKCSTITNSEGTYELLLDKNQNYVIKFSRYDGYKGEIKTGTVTASNNGPWNFTSKSSLLFNIVSLLTKRTFMISGCVKHPDTGKPVSGAVVKIVKGQHNESQVMTMKPEVTLTTDSKGYFFTAALPFGQYDVWAYRPISNSKNCLTKIVNINNLSESTLDITLEKKKRFYVTGFCIHPASTSSGAKEKTKSNYTLIDVDLNKNAPGDWIYLSYGLSNSCKPITNLLIYESNKEESWTTKEITHNNITALYHRLSVNLNKNAGGKYLYVCYTYDTQFDPLTKLDVIVDDNNTIRSPHWSGVRVVRENNYSVDSYADANEGLRYGDTVHIMQTRKEIM